MAACRRVVLAKMENGILRKELAGFMARKSLIEREKARDVAKYADKRQALIEQNATSQREKLELHRQIQQFRNSAPNRKLLGTGRPGASTKTLAFLVTCCENGLTRVFTGSGQVQLVVQLLSTAAINS